MTHTTVYSVHKKIVGKEHYVDVKNVMIMGGGVTAVRTVKTMPSYMDEDYRNRRTTL